VVDTISQLRQLVKLDIQRFLWCPRTQRLMTLWLYAAPATGSSYHCASIICDARRSTRVR
jgi:hypothetical protein